MRNMSVKSVIVGLLVVSVQLLSGCGSTPTNKASKNVAPVTNGQAQSPVSAYEKIAAQYIHQSFDNNAQHQARNSDLLQLADSYAQNGDCISAEIVVHHIDNSIVSPNHRSLANLLKIECQLTQIDGQTSNLEEAINAQLLDLLSTWLTQVQKNHVGPEYRARFAIAEAKIAANQGDYANALRALANEPSSIDAIGPEQTSNLIWQWYSLLQSSQKKRLQNEIPFLNDYATLFNLIEDTSVNDSIRQSSIKSWLAQNPTRSLAMNLPEQLTRYLAINSIQEQKIAVLLPLSGRLSTQGEVIKQGLLTAYLARVAQSSGNQNQPSTQIEFFDTGSDNTLPNTINTERLAQYEIIIGPLLKSHIEQVQLLDLPNLKQVALNQNQLTQIGAKGALSENSISAYFALSPEQEAQQLVLLMRGQNITNPILIKDNSSISTRMATAFNNAWLETAQQGNNNSLDVNARSVQEITYTNNKSMRVGITSALDVLQSQRRIQQLSNLNQERVYSVTRNRRDVDAFVVFAQPDELELINPIIESSISLFTDEQLPVFATSYGYDHKQSKNSQRDLRNLVFIDMPWLVDGNRNDALSKQVDRLFNSPPSTFLRLFAFGYDALAIADNIAQLSTFDYMKIKGLSGTLSFANNNFLNRELAWIAITENSQSAN